MQHFPIALDVMGGDHAPYEIIKGAVIVAREGIAIMLFGDQTTIELTLSMIYSDWKTLPLTITHCSEQISMDEEPTKSVIKKYDSSLVKAIKSVADGTCCAIVSAGNSGAVLIAATLNIGRVPGVLRPTIGTFLPTVTGSVFCLDLGANTDCKPAYLEQFALMGSAYVQLTQDIKNPRIGLLSNGSEPYKGSELVKATYKLLEYNSQLNFVGNIEARDIFDGTADVVVCDGFAGNILLKTAQGTARAISTWLKQEYHNSWRNKLGFWLSAGAFASLKKKTNYERQGGALLLGVNKPVIIAHGCSEASAIAQAIRYAHTVSINNSVIVFNTLITDLINKKEFYHSNTMTESRL